MGLMSSWALQIARQQTSERREMQSEERARRASHVLSSVHQSWHGSRHRQSSDAQGAGQDRSREALVSHHTEVDSVTVDRAVPCDRSRRASRSVGAEGSAGGRLAREAREVDDEGTWNARWEEDAS